MSVTSTRIRVNREFYCTVYSRDLMRFLQLSRFHVENREFLVKYDDLGLERAEWIVNH